MQLFLLWLGVIAPARLAALPFMATPEEAFWGLCLVSPVAFCIMVDSFAQHLALALWLNAFMLSCLSSPEPIVLSFFLHLISLYFRAQLVRSTHQMLALKEARLQGLYDAMSRFHDVLDHQVKNLFIAAEGELAMILDIPDMAVATIRYHIEQVCQTLRRGITQ